MEVLLTDTEIYILTNQCMMMQALAILTDNKLSPKLLEQAKAIINMLEKELENAHKIGKTSEISK